MLGDKKPSGGKQEKNAARERRSRLRLSDLERLADHAVRTHVHGELRGKERRKKSHGDR
jgi:hypothetical protein